MNSTPDYYNDMASLWLHLAKVEQPRITSQIFKRIKPQANETSGSGSNQESSQVGGEVETLGTTVTHLTDAVVKIAEQCEEISIPKTLVSVASDGTMPSIKTYLGKPMEYASGTLSTADTHSTFPLFDVFSLLQTHTMMMYKLTGTFAIRATTVLTLQVNATRFQQGRYILAFLSNGGGSTTSVNSSSWKVMHTVSPTTVTQLPHVELDLATDTQVQLRIPYLSYNNACPVVTNTVTTYNHGSPGWGFMYPYSPLVAGSGSTTASYTLWVHYEDVDLLGNMAPQSGRSKRNMKTAKKGESSNLLPTDQEQRKPGIVETGAGVVKKVADYCVSIPVLSAFAAPVSWTAEFVGKVASLFGWSKPLLIEDTRRAHLEMFPYMASANGKDDVVPLSINAKNMIDVMPGFAATDIDELSIDYLKDIYAYYTTLTLTTSTADAALLTSFSVGPSFFDTTFTETGLTYVVPTPVGYLSSLFTWYRGGLKFRFKFVKTEFHSGRIMVAFFPQDLQFYSGALPTPTIAYTDYVQKTIIDIRNCNEFEFEVPYMSVSSWKNTGTAQVLSASPTLLTNREPYGTLAIFNLQPLEAPSSVSSSISIIIEVKGAPDLEFAFPQLTNFCPVVPMTIQSGNLSTGQVDLGVVGQANEGDDSIIHSSACIGESIKSLRTLLKRPSVHSVTGASGIRTVQIYPQASYICENVSGTLNYADRTLDLISTLNCMYALQRGSIRFRYLPLQCSTSESICVNIVPASSAAGTALSAKPSYSTSAYSNGAVALNMNNSPFTFLRSDWGIGIQIPFYAKTHSLSCMNNISSNTLLLVTPGWYGSSATVLQLFNDSTDNGLNGKILRYGGEDFNFGGFVSTVPLCVPENSWE